MNEPVGFVYRRKVKKFAKNVVHIFDGTDTYCKICENPSTKQEDFEVSDNFPEDANRVLCIVCMQAYESKK